MKKNEPKNGYDQKYLYACMAMAGYRGYGQGICGILNISTTAANRRTSTGNFTRKEIMTLAKACNMNAYDVIRCFFADFLIEDEESRNQLLRDVLIELMV